MTEGPLVLLIEDDPAMRRFLRAALGTQIFSEVRGQRLPLQVASMPFVPNTYKR